FSTNNICKLPAFHSPCGTLWTAISICGRIPPLMRSCKPVGKCGTSLGQVLPCYRPALQASESGHHLNRSCYVGSRTGCGQVVQCLEGVWVHSTPVGRGRLRSLFRHSDGWVQVSERR